MEHIVDGYLADKADHEQRERDAILAWLCAEGKGVQCVTFQLKKKVPWITYSYAMMNSMHSIDMQIVL